MKTKCFRVTAIHEAAHAVIATELGLPWEHCWAVAGEGKLHLSLAMGVAWESFAGAVATLAGPVAQVRFNRRGWEWNFWQGIEKDLADAEKYLDRENLGHAWAVARKLVRERWPAIEIMANRLQRGTVWNTNTSIVIKRHPGRPRKAEQLARQRDPLTTDFLNGKVDSEGVEK